MGAKARLFMANLIYGAEDAAVWPQTGIQTEVTGVRVREMTHAYIKMCTDCKNILYD